jgi:cytochrome c oxidase assembly protein subunit 15
VTQNSFISAKYRRGSMLALFTFAFALVVIALGAYTRLTDAGLSCPDWPNCYGYLTAPHTTSQLEGAVDKYPLMPVDVKKAWTEMIHRYFAGTEGLFILLLSGSIFFTRKAKDAKSIAIGLLLLGLLILQISLGMLTVTEKLRPVIVLSHLLTALSILSVLWWAYLDLHIRDDFFTKDRSAKRLLPWLWAGLLVVAAQITLGGWVSTHYAGLACIDFPYCNGTLLPTMQWGSLNTDLITIHMLHRFGAYTTGIALTLISIVLLRKPSFRANGLAILGLVSLQITLGILNVIWLRPVWVAMIHQFVAIILLLAMITAVVKANVESRS